MELGCEEWKEQWRSHGLGSVCLCLCLGRDGLSQGHHT